ncbi:hypothetical protein HY404_00215 [Candidatus Microgenomates bacterium]|nr:hypothetical protein [Candidatus Microgenomates bacterium]
MKRILLLLLFLLPITYYLLPSKVLAEGEFATVISTRYEVKTSGQTHVAQTITLTNLFSTIQAISYSFIISGTDPQNIHALQNNQAIPTEISTNNHTTNITLKFPDAVVGKGKSRTFTIEYEDAQIAIKNGQVWEISIPKVEKIGEYQDYQVILAVPKGLGDPAYLSPPPASKNNDDTLNFYQWQKDQLTTSGVVAAFGTFQIFGFELAYHLANPLQNLGETEIALPPDTAFQKIYYEKIEPAPLSIRMDRDGNWLAKYRLKQSEKMDIYVKGAAQLFASPQNSYLHNNQNLNDYLTPTKYWQADSPEIKELAKKYRTVREIYNYVVNTLTYDFSRVRQDTKRMGALAALANPKNAICMEFTDLFIAISRAAGIPAREINGYAYTENTKIQPLSLVADVLHAWPEYWDGKRQAWVAVDPTWGNTTGGIDFFTKLDLAHFAFVIHGTDPEMPLPAGSYKLANNPQKDVSVFFGALPEKKSELNLNFKVSQQFIPFQPIRGKLLVYNAGPAALYNVKLEFSVQEGRIIHPTPTINFLPPFATVEVLFSYLPASLLLNQGQINVVVNSFQKSYTIGTDFLLWQILGLFILLIILTVFIIILVKYVGKKITIKPPRFPWRLPF